MTISLKNLQEIAERASKGEWVADDNIVFCDGESVALDCRHNDASFIAIANPTTALALIRVARAAKDYVGFCHEPDPEVRESCIALYNALEGIDW